MYRLIGYSGRRRFTHKVNGGCSALIVVAVIEARVEQAEFEILIRTEFLSLLDQLHTDDAAVVDGVARGADRVGVVIVLCALAYTYDDDLDKFKYRDEVKIVDVTI